MPADKKNTAKEAAATGSTATAPTARKAWTPKTPIDVFLEQIERQESRVAKLQAEIDAEKLTLNKLRKAKDILEAS
jgi:hypothetical protein